MRIAQQFIIRSSLCVTRRAENYDSDMVMIAILLFVVGSKRNTNNNDIIINPSRAKSIFFLDAPAQNQVLPPETFSSTWIINVWLRAHEVYVARSQSTCYYVITFVI